VALDNIKDGTLASIQVVTSGQSGNALYNCADIRFTKNATQLSNCSDSEGMIVQNIKEQIGNGTDPAQNVSSDGNSTGTDDKKNAASPLGNDQSLVLATVVFLAAGFSLGLGL
jgi:predicted carbohydrate-binding protein with CBM5 and CBM33 domain